MKKKLFYSCVDCLIPSPLSEQHMVIKKKAEAENGIISAYASEEVRFASNQPWIFIKLKETKGLDGVIFFSVDQFLYGDHFNLKLFKNIIDYGYEIHFARENFSFYKNIDKNEILNFLISHDLIFRREQKELFNLV